MRQTASSRQLALALEHSESYMRDDFIVGPSNSAALEMIDRWPDWPDSVLALVGPEGSGKSHLASIWADNAGARFIAARSLADSNLPAALATGALVLEDVPPAGVDERSLLHLLNLAREQKAFVLLTARSSPASWPVELPDLASRLRALVTVAVAAPDERLLRALIVKLAADRQMELDDLLVSYLFHRVERSFAGAREAVNRLDREAMRLKRPVTRALAAELFRDT